MSQDLTNAFEDRYYSHAINLMHEEKRLRRKMLGLLKEMEKDIISQIDDGGMAIRMATGRDRESRLNSLLGSVRNSIKTSYEELNTDSSSYLKDFSMRDADNQVGLLNGTLQAPLYSTGFTPLMAKTVVDTTHIRGALMSNWWEKQSANTDMRIVNSIQLGYMEGETIDQIKRRLIGKSTGKFQILEVNGKPRRVYERAGGIVNVSTREAEAMARTSIQAISNRVRDQIFAENEDIISEVESVATFDSRTTPLCASYDGLRWNQKTHKPVGHKKKYLPTPRHWNCRSTHVPVIPDLDDLDRHANQQGVEIPQAIRATVDGEQPAMIPMDAWLKQKPFPFQQSILGGAGKVRLFRDGKISLRDLTDDQGRVLSLNEIQGMLDLPPPPKPTPKILKDLGKLNILEGKKVVSIKPSERFQALSSSKLLEDSEIQNTQLTKEWKEAFAETDRIQKLHNYDIPDDVIGEYEAKRKKGLEIGQKLSAVQKTIRDEKKRIKEVIDNELFLPEEDQAKPTYSVFRGLDRTGQGIFNKGSVKRLLDAEIWLKKVLRKDRMPKVGVQKLRGSKWESRAFYRDNEEKIYITEKESTSVIVHEICHDLEFKHPWIMKKAQDFLRKRSGAKQVKTAGGKTVWVGGDRPESLREVTKRNFDPKELFYRDEWKKKGGEHYMGKIYGDGATELVTMGAERLLKDAGRFAREDPEYFDFMIEIFQGV